MSASRPSKMSVNAVANLAGKLANASLGFVFIPIYLSLMGVDAYGLVGFYTALLGTLMLADFGLSAAFTRECARLSLHSAGSLALAQILRATELFFLGLAFLIVLVVALVSERVAVNWLDASSLGSSLVASSVLLMGLAFGAQLPGVLYQGGLEGLQRHAVVNVVLVSANALRGISGVVSLLLTDGDPRAFFVSQVLVSAASSLTLRRQLRALLPAPADHRPPLLDTMRPLFRFAAGMMGIGITSILLTQLDKLLLSKLLPLDDFAFYSLASMMAAVPAILASPIGTAAYPRMTQILQGSPADLAALYHAACQVVAVLVLPVGLTLHFFAEPIVLAWTGDLIVARGVAPLLSILVLGSTMLALMILPYRLQLAAGWTRLPLLINLAAIVILGPALFILARVHGAVGAAWIWVALNGIYVLVTVQLMHRRLLLTEKAHWYWQDVIRPASAVALSAGLSSHLLLGAASGSRGLALLMVAGTLVATVIAAVLVSPFPRRFLSGAVVKFVARMRQDLVNEKRG